MVRGVAVHVGDGAALPGSQKGVTGEHVVHSGVEPAGVLRLTRSAH